MSLSTQKGQSIPAIVAKQVWNYTLRGLFSRKPPAWITPVLLVAALAGYGWFLGECSLCLQRAHPAPNIIMLAALAPALRLAWRRWLHSAHTLLRLYFINRDNFLSVLEA